jgi:ADP-heptose:LPS heptosyltransferase
MNLVRLGPRFSDLAETAAAMACLDLVITVDGSPAHLAGAIGAPTWLLLRRECDPRWLIDDPSAPDRTV